MSEKDVVATEVTAALPGFGPVGRLERIETLDVLRGVALLAILIVNWTVNSRWDNDAWKALAGRRIRSHGGRFTFFWMKKPGRCSLSCSASDLLFK